MSSFKIVNAESVINDVINEVAKEKMLGTKSNLNETKKPLNITHKRVIVFDTITETWKLI